MWSPASNTGALSCDGLIAGGHIKSIDCPSSIVCESVYEETRRGLSKASKSYRDHSKVSWKPRFAPPSSRAVKSRSPVS
jgi:hypothetical protein